jgi:hypothetical protein
MTQTSKYPNSASAWVEYLAKRSLPSPLQLAKKCSKNLENDKLSYHEIAELLSADPIACLAIMQHANVSKTDHDIFSKTLDHAMSMLGVDALKGLLQKVPHLEEKYAYRDYYRAIDSSLLHAFFAQLFAKTKHYAKHQEVFWAALFADAPIWYLWCFATPLMKEWSKTPKHLQAEKELELFGSPIIEIQKTMLEHIGAPELALRSLEETHVPSKREWLKLDRAGQALRQKNAILAAQCLETPQLKVHIQSPELFICMSHFCLSYLDAPIYRHRSRATSVALPILKGSKQRISEIFTQGLITYSKKFSFPYSLPAACRYILLLDILSSENQAPAEFETSRSKARKQSSSAQAPKTAGASKAQITPAKTEFRYIEDFKPGPEYTKLIKRMKNELSSFDSAHELMQEAVTAIGTGLKLQRALIALVSKDKSRLKAYYTEGMNDQDPLKGFDTKIISGTIFKVLCERQAGLWVKSDTKQSIANLIPMNFKQLTQTEEGIFVSIFVNERPVAIFYADQGEDSKSIVEEQFRYVKLMVKTLEAALLQLRNQKKKTS